MNGEEKLNVDVRGMVVDSLEKFENGDKGAPFERSILKALLAASQKDPAEFQRLKATLVEKGVSVRDLSNALKQEKTLQMLSSAVNPSQALFSPEKTRELEEKGFRNRPSKRNCRHSAESFRKVHPANPASQADNGRTVLPLQRGGLVTFQRAPTPTFSLPTFREDATKCVSAQMGK